MKLVHEAETEQHSSDGYLEVLDRRVQRSTILLKDMMGCSGLMVVAVDTRGEKTEVRVAVEGDIPSPEDLAVLVETALKAQEGKPTQN